MATNNDVIKTLTNHVTVRHFTEKPISEELLSTILNAARRSPTSSNMQTYSMIVVRNQAAKVELAKLAGNQKHIETCPVFIAFCADIHRLATACEMHDVTLVKSLETTLVATIDAALVGMSVQTAAESCGLGAVMIGGMRNHPHEAGQLLGLPSGVYVVYGMCLGWPDLRRYPPQKPRLPEDMVIHQEKYNDDLPQAHLAAYDQALAEHYQALGRNLHADAWTGPIARRLKNPARPYLRKTLEEMGFKFD